MNDSLYKDIILEHYKNPLQYGVIKNPDIAIDDYNPLCGDEIHLTIKIKDSKVIDIQFTSIGCVISKASASIFLEFVLNKKITEVKKISQEEFLNLLNLQLTASRFNCALLVFSALKKALISQS